MSAKTDNFIKKLAPLAIAERKKRDKWVLPSVCIAQAALETGWGTSSLMIKANAFFGIKATASWKGKVYNSRTSECYDGVNFTNITACFRAYDNLADSVADYYNLICNSSRYKAAVNNSDYKAAAAAIKNGGYATDPEYASKVVSIIESYNLTQYDKIEQEEKEVTIEEIIAAMKAKGFEVKANTDNELRFVKAAAAAPSTTVFNNGDKVKLKDGCTYYNGKSIPSWVRSKTLYYRGKNKNGLIFSTLKSGAVTGIVKEGDLIKL